MKKIKSNKKGVFYAEIVPQVFSYIALVLILIIFFVLFNIKGCDDGINQKITSEKNNLDVENNLMNYLKTPVEYNGETITIADIVSMVDIEEDKDKKTKIFQENVKNTFEQIYPSKSSDNQMVYNWWIRVYDKNEEPSIGKAFSYSDGKYIWGIAAPGKGYQYNTGRMCDPKGGQYSDEVSTVIVPKVNGGYVKVVFCIWQ